MGQSGGGRALVDPWCGLTIVSGADFDQPLVDINVLHDFHHDVTFRGDERLLKAADPLE